MTGRHVLETCFSTLGDTTAAVYEGACGGPAIACNDDSCGGASRVEFDAVTGQRYLLRIGNTDFPSSFAFGTFRLQTVGPVRSPLNGHDYEVVDETVCWGAARSGAEARSVMGTQGHLATITSAAERDVVHGLLGARERVWIGGFQDLSSPSFSDPGGGWTWVTGEDFAFTDWGPGEPNEAGAATFRFEDFLELKRVPAFGPPGWNDAFSFCGFGDGVSLGYIVEYPTPPACAPLDPFEPNDWLCAPVEAPFGVVEGLRVGPTAPDHYSTSSGFDGVTFAIDFDSTQADLDLFLYEAPAGTDCSTWTQILSSTTSSDHEVIRVFPGGFASRLVLEVRSNGTQCSEYTPTVGRPGLGSLGDTVCFQNPTSSGFPAEIYAFGSRVAAANNFSLSAAGLPAAAFGIFLVSRGYRVIQNPAGSRGDLCIAGDTIGRYVGPGQIQFSDSNGNVNMPVDLTETPQGGAFASVAASETWYFQHWTREVFAGSFTSHYTSAIQVRFE